MEVDSFEKKVVWEIISSEGIKTKNPASSPA